MSNQEPSNYFEYIIRDANSYQAVLSGANVEISQLEPGRLSGRHVRLGLPGGQFSCVETNLSMRGTGTFPNLWTLSVILECKGRSLQHGLEVRAGSLLIHGPGAEHDGVYGRDFKIVCFSVRDEILAKHLRRRSRQLQNAVRQPWSVFDPAPESRREIMAHFGEAAAIVQSDSRVRRSDHALEKFQDELVGAFLEAVAQQFPSNSIGTDQRVAEIVQRVDQVAQESRLVSTSVVELCDVCKVSRRTLNRAFQDTLGMGPVTYLRRVRLNRARRTLQRKSKRSITVTDVALDLGFWHLGRFAEQYNELFDESPHETLRRADRGINAYS